MRAQLARVDAVLVQALIAAALSFAHLHDIASAAGQDGWKAWAYPVSVDLLLVAAWRRLRSGEAKAAGWCWFVIALAASLGANVATAGLLDLNDVPAWLRILVAGWPAVAFLGGTLLAHSTPTTTDKGPEDTDDTVDQEHVPGLAPDEPPPTPPAIEPPPPERAAVPVPAALVEHARKVAAEHHTRTGTPIDTPTLRARLGVPAPMAEAIAAHLAPTGSWPVPLFCFNTAADYLEAAREMAVSGRTALARLLAEEAADRVTDPAEAARILHDFPGPSLRQED